MEQEFAAAAPNRWRESGNTTDATPQSPGTRLPGRVWLKILPAFGLALAVAQFLPRGGSGAQPPVGTLLTAAVLITAITTAALYFGIRMDLRLPARVALYAVAWNALVVLVKFGLAPHGMYEVNQEVAFDTFAAPDEAGGAVATAALVFLLYVAAYVVLYRLIRGRLVAALPRPGTRGLMLALVVGVLALATSGGALLLLPLVAFGGGVQYLDFVFSSGVSLLVATALAGASALAALALRDVRDRANLIGDAAVLVTFFWLGLAFLALYHVLWVVYVLALAATWPLRVVVPK